MNTANEEKKPATYWNEAICDAEDRVAKLDRERARLRAAIRLMKRQIRAGIPWPGGAPTTKGDGD